MTKICLSVIHLVKNLATAVFTIPGPLSLPSTLSFSRSELARTGTYALHLPRERERTVRTDDYRIGLLAPLYGSRQVVLPAEKS